MKKLKIALATTAAVALLATPAMAAFTGLSADATMTISKSEPTYKSMKATGFLYATGTREPHEYTFYTFKVYKDGAVIHSTGNTGYSTGGTENTTGSSYFFTAREEGYYKSSVSGYVKNVSTGATRYSANDTSSSVPVTFN